MKMILQIVLNFSLNVIGDFNDEINFSHTLLITNTRVSRIRKAFVNGSKTPKMVRLGGVFNVMDPFGIIHLAKNL